MATARPLHLVASAIVGGWAALAIVGPAWVEAAPPDKQVIVENTEANPALVRDVDNAARHAFQTATSTLTNQFNTTGFGLTLTTVPPGEVLVIEFISALCQGQPTIPSTLRLSTSVDHFFALTPTTFPAEGVASQITRIYAGPGSSVRLSVFPTTNTATMTCNVAISGYRLSQ